VISDCGLSVNLLDWFYPAFALLAFVLGYPVALSVSYFSIYTGVSLLAPPSSLYLEDLDTSFNQALLRLLIDVDDSLFGQQDLSNQTEFVQT
jgi:hypothetical protein